MKNQKHPPTMRTKSLFLFLISLSLMSCRTHFRNMRIFEVDHEACKAFVVIKQDWSYPVGFVDREDRLIMIHAGLDTLGQVTSFWLSPSHHRVMIESFGEGHQFITIYDIDAIVRDYESDRLKPIKTLDPYPGIFWDIKWIDDDHIQFSSPADFNQFDDELRRGLYPEDDEADRTWQWNIVTDTFKKISDQPKS